MANQKKTYSFSLKKGLDPKIQEWLEMQDNMSESIIALISNWIAHNGMTKLTITPTIVSTKSGVSTVSVNQEKELHEALAATTLAMQATEKSETKPLNYNKTSEINASSEEKDNSQQNGDLLSEKELLTFNSDALNNLF